MRRLTRGTTTSEQTWKPETDAAALIDPSSREATRKLLCSWTLILEVESGARLVFFREVETALLSSVSVPLTPPILWPPEYKLRSPSSGSRMQFSNHICERANKDMHFRWQRLSCGRRPAQEVSLERKSRPPQLHRCMTVFFLARRRHKDQSRPLPEHCAVFELIFIVPHHRGVYFNLFTTDSVRARRVPKGTILQWEYLEPNKVRCVLFFSVPHIVLLS